MFFFGPTHDAFHASGCGRWGRNAMGPGPGSRLRRPASQRSVAVKPERTSICPICFRELEARDAGSWSLGRSASVGNLVRTNLGATNPGPSDLGRVRAHETTSSSPLAFTKPFVTPDCPGIDMFWPVGASAEIADFHGAGWTGNVRPQCPATAGAQRCQACQRFRAAFRGVHIVAPDGASTSKKYLPSRAHLDRAALTGTQNRRARLFFRSAEIEVGRRTSNDYGVPRRLKLGPTLMRLDSKSPQKSHPPGRTTQSRTAKSI